MGKKPLIRNILAACLERKMSEADLMARIGVSAAAWKRMRVGGQAISAHNLVLICKQLDVTSDFLLGLSPYMLRLEKEEEC